MRRISPPVLGATVLVCLAGIASAGTRQFEYLSPIPDAQFVRPQTNLIVREGRSLDASTVSSALFRIRGSKSGDHTGTARLADDGRTVLYRPDRPFEYGERVTVQLRRGIRTREGSPLRTVHYRFQIMENNDAMPAPRARPSLESMLGPEVWSTSRAQLPVTPEIRLDGMAPPATVHAAGSAGSQAVPPTGYPYGTLLNTRQPRPGQIFFAPFRASDANGQLVILDDSGEPLFFRRLADQGITIDFRPQPGNRLSAFVSGRSKFLIWNDEYALVDSVTAGNGYSTDGHELLLLENGHAILMSYDAQRVAMDRIVPGGRPDAIVEGLVVQELDASGEVVFQWRSWDHFDIEDVAVAEVALTDSVIDYVHGNSIEVDHDGDLLLSSRHLNEVTKVSRRTGEVLWRFAPNGKHNDFQMLNDPLGFTHQHDARRLPSGELTLFDNGNGHTPPTSRGVRYELDEEARTARLTWEYQHPGEVFGPFMGNVRWPGGEHAFICWGGNALGPDATEIGPGGDIEQELSILTGSWTYRALRAPWQANRLALSSDTLDLGLVPLGTDVFETVRLTNRTASAITIEAVRSTSPFFRFLSELPIEIAPGAEIEIEIMFSPSGPGEYLETLYLQEFGTNQLIATPLRVRGRTDPVVAVGDGEAFSFRLYRPAPNPFRTQVRIEFELPRAAAIRLEVFDVRGRRVEVLREGPTDAGRHVSIWQPRHLPSGLYFCRLAADGESRTVRVARVE